jgi:HSP20 family molecular chaperone IbpA
VVGAFRDTRFLLRPIYYGAFERSFTLSTSIDPNRIKATCDLGVLTLTLPKAETAKPHLITVEVAPVKALRA